MNNATLLRARVARINADYPTTQDDTCATALRQSDGGEAVSESRLSDSERDAAIKRAGAALESAMSRKEAARRRYEASSCLLDRADMDAAGAQARAALSLMERLIRGRSAAQVLRMERERGLV